MQDASADVRAAAIRLNVGTGNPAVIQCLRDRAFAVEVDNIPRMALLDVLAHTNDPAAADILCDAMAFWVKSYVKDKPVEDRSDLDIAWFQNQRDYERSPLCVARAYKAGGFTCHGKAYLGGKLLDLGGAGTVPDCDGTGKGRGPRAPREVSFGD
jgi:hypothetical protein